MPPDAGAALVTGATGFIGRALVNSLAASGRRVVAVTRRTAPAMPASVEVRAADLATGEGVTPALVDGVSHVFHCAGEIRNASAMRALHVDGTARLLRALAGRASTGRVHWVQLSSVGAYGPPRPANAPRQVTEDTPEHPAGDYEATKTESDRLVREAGERGLISWTLLRPSAVIGPGMSNASLPGLIAMVRRGLFFHIGPDGSIANYVHVDDVVGALMLCGDDPRASGETFNLSSDCTWTALVNRVASVAGVAQPRVRIPAGLVRPLSPRRVDVLTNRTQYPSTKIQSTLAFPFARPMPQAVDELVTPR